MTPFFSQKTKYRKYETANSGFTMVELLTVIAILLLVGLIAVFSLSKLRRSLRQHELDARAEIIYVAAQNRMAELRAAGCEGLYSKGLSDGDNGVYAMAFDGTHMDESSRDVEFCYLYVNDASDKRTGAPAALLPDTAVDKDLWNGCWCIEYAPSTGSIYAVFYSESPLPSHTDLNGSYRNFNYRARTASVGYYGGDIAQTQDISKFNPSISIENAEKLTVTFYSNNPSDDTSAHPLTFTITISDQFGGSYTRTVTGLQGGLQQLDSRNYKYQWVLDDLASPNKRFFAQTVGKVSCGTPITIKLTVSSTDPSIDTVFTTRTTNGLFDDRTDLGYGENTALLAYGRHLANLSDASHVNAAIITSAVQVDDISFFDDPSDKTDWYSLYTANGVKFSPIYNKNLTSFSGIHFASGSYEQHIINGLTVSSSSAAGLFSTFSGKISNAVLVNAQISGGVAGGLAARTSGALTLENCRVYLTELSGLKATSADAVPARITGTTAGGLVGIADHSLTIQNSFASTIIKGSTAAAGLVGHAQGAVSVSRSYADGYITAPVTGGLVGTTGSLGGISLTDSYAAGYQTATAQAAGFVAGRLANARSSYSACAFPGTPQIIYTTAAAGNATDVSSVFYLTSGLDGQNVQSLTETTQGRSYPQMSAASFLTELNSTAFTTASADTTQPYNLLSQGLSTYSYPRLTGLSHYGDWQAEFEAEALVYYERYADATVGFFGGNVDRLDDNKVITGDGYAVALSAPLTGTQAITVQCGTVSTVLDVSSSYYFSSYEGISYYLYPVSALTSGISSGGSFYRTVTVNERSYQFNPYFAKTVTTGSTAGSVPGTVYLRTARHLYELSCHYDDYDTAAVRSTFLQECHISYTSYDWANYTSYGAVSTQTPINGTAENDGETGGFRAIYNGDYHTIEGVSFVSAGNDVGMFAVIAPTGTVRNVTLLSSGAERVERSGLLQGSATVVYMGVLAGRNYGTISNCAVSGYGFGSGTGILAYQHSTVYMGGLVGGNLYHKTHSGRILSSEANCPTVQASSYNASIYAGGFAGSNAGGSIQSCYALGVLKALDVSSSTVRLCGFAGENTGGALAYCYSATALTAAGEAEVYGLTRTGGSTAQCYYLDGGTYAYNNELYAYTVSRNSFSVNAAQSPITGARLESLRLYGFSGVTSSGTETVYPYPAVVRDRIGRTVHYGAWPVQQHIGTMGVFYWEREQGGNAGYHLSYIGTDNGVAFSGSTLCVQHNDSGVVMEYGYGYFFKPGDLTDTVQLSVSANCHLGAANATAASALEAQMPDYRFVAYTTGVSAATDTTYTGAMYLTTMEANCTWTLRYQNASAQYTVCPFFADAISLDSVNGTATGSAKPGETGGSAYQVRSVSQLQNINWNYVEKNATSSIKGAPEQMPFQDDQGSDYWNAYPYLVRYQPQDTTHVKEKRTNNFQDGWNENRDAAITLISDSGKGLYWAQSHDVDAYVEVGKEDDNFTPIGGLQDIMETESPHSKPCTAFFAGSFNGQDYTIRNISITSSAQCVGLFGFTSGAQLRNIVMYSDRGSVIKNTADGQNWYCLGGLVGFAGAGSADTSTATLTNCSVSGYTIQDNWKNIPGWGGGCVGGLVGATNMNITGCTAVTDIVLRIAYEKGWTNLRVGGIAGVCRATLDKCYAGGSIKSTSTVPLKENASKSTSIWASGLVGGIMLRYEGGLSKLVGKADNTLFVKNSYAFVEMPKSGENTVRRSMAIASNGEMQDNNFDQVNNSNAYIENCYALVDAAQSTDDYKEQKGANWSTQVVLSRANKAGWRYTYLTNSGNTPYITYEQMQTELKNWLNGGTSDSSLRFDTVTVTENGAPIPGKYSFPGAGAEMLDGLDFPFPTILTQRDVMGRTVSVHYGRWPMSGLYWARTQATLDLCADRTGEGAPTLTVKLYPKPDGTTLNGTPTLTLVNDTDGQVSDLLDWTAPVYNSAERCWEVTFTGKGRMGLAIARATLGGYTAELTIHVTQTLRLTSDKASSGVTVTYGGAGQTVQLLLTDAKNDPIAVKSGERLAWEVTATKQGGGYDPGDESIVECSNVTAVDAAKGLYQFTVTGFSDGISTVTVMCTYTYPEDDEIKTVTARSLLSAKSTRDAVGLVYDAAEPAYDAAAFAYRVTKDTAVYSTGSVYTVASGVYRRAENDISQWGTADVTVPEFPRETGKLYLFAGSGYTGLGDFTVDLTGLTAVDAAGKSAAVTAAGLGDIQSAEGVQYREVLFNSADAALISGEIRLTHSTDGTVYTLYLEDFAYAS